MYISRIDGDVITYDIRMKRPNGGDYLSNAVRYQLRHTPIYSFFELISVSVGYYVVVALL